jgi:C-terminal processing protease CtpA/Prc
MVSVAETNPQPHEFQEFMENYGVQPDIRVDNAPEDNLGGRDRQLETAVEELLKQLSGPKRNIATKEQ